MSTGHCNNGRVDRCLLETVTMAEWTGVRWDLRPGVDDAEGDIDSTE